MIPFMLSGIRVVQMKTTSDRQDSTLLTATCTLGVPSVCKAIALSSLRCYNNDNNMASDVYACWVGKRGMGN